MSGQPRVYRTQGGPADNLAARRAMAEAEMRAEDERVARASQGGWITGDVSGDGTRNTSTGMGPPQQPQYSQTGQTLTKAQRKALKRQEWEAKNKNRSTPTTALINGAPITQNQVMLQQAQEMMRIDEINRKKKEQEDKKNQQRYMTELQSAFKHPDLDKAFYTDRGEIPEQEVLFTYNGKTYDPKQSNISGVLEVDFDLMLPNKGPGIQIKFQNVNGAYQLITYKDGKFHSFNDQPAFQSIENNKGVMRKRLEWYKDGALHRYDRSEHKPAVHIEERNMTPMTNTEKMILENMSSSFIPEYKTVKETVYYMFYVNGARSRKELPAVMVLYKWYQRIPSSTSFRLVHSQYERKFYWKGVNYTPPEKSELSDIEQEYYSLVQSYVDRELSYRPGFITRNNPLNWWWGEEP